jgi:hypothetical protein
MFWHPDLQWFRDAPAAGQPACLCSWCGEAIAAERDCVRLGYGDPERYELRCHALCFAYVTTAEGLIFDDLDDLLLHWRPTHA